MRIRLLPASVEETASTPVKRHRDGKVMSRKFHASIQQASDLTYLKITGVIDEDNELYDLTDDVATGTLVIDQSDVERINSCGIRDWIRWLDSLKKRGVNVVLAECSPAVVSQINLIGNFIRNSSILSFYAPYFCPTCQTGKALLIDIDEVAESVHPRAPLCRCDECDGLMEFDDMEEIYFAFVATVSKARLTSEQHQAMDELSKPGRTSGGRKMLPRGGSSLAISTGASNEGNARGSFSTGASGPSLPSVPSLPALESLKEPRFDQLEDSSDGSSTVKGSLDSTMRSRWTTVLIVLLLLIAIGLLVFVILTEKKRQRDSSRTERKTETSELVIGLLHRPLTSSCQVPPSPSSSGPAVL